MRDMAALRGKLTTTQTPSGKTVRMQPAAVDIPGVPSDFAFPAKYGEHTLALLHEAGYAEEECRGLLEQGIIAG